MPRKASGRHEKQRARQERYRKRLRSTGTPEADVVDFAVSASVSALAEALVRQREEAKAAVAEHRQALRERLANGSMPEDEAEEAFAELMLPRDAPPDPVAPEVLLRTLLQGAVSLLVDKNCDPEAAWRKLRHRLGRGGDPHSWTSSSGSPGSRWTGRYGAAIWKRRARRSG